MENPVVQSHNEKLQMRFTVNALERLIGGDREIEMVLSQQAIQQIIKNRMQLVEKVVHERIGEYIQNAFGQHHISYNSVTGKYDNVFMLSTEARNAVSETIKAMVETTIHNYLQQNQHEIRSKVQEEIKKQTESWIKHAIKTEHERLIKKLTTEIAK